MKPLSPRIISIFSSRSLSANAEIHQHSLLQISHFSTSPIPSHSSSFPSRRHEEDARNVRVSVWWDFENCSLPVGSNVFRITQSITAAIRANGIKGPIQITAFGDVLQLSRSNQEALSSTGINLTHIPHGGKNSADRSLLVDLMYWVSQNPPPAHLFLISGDRDFASTLHRLRMNNYNILLASPESTPAVLCSAASIMWHWNALVKGENLAGKHFNQPPDGPYGSWYGHYRAPLEDPFAATEQPACLGAEELSESASDPKLRPIPKTVMRQIRCILNSYPKGLSITELRSELGKRNVSIDKDLYGYKKFSRFLLAMPHILKLQYVGEGQFFVRSITPKVPEQVESTPSIATGPVTNNGDPDFTITPKLNGEDGSTQGVGEEFSCPLTPEPYVKGTSIKLQEPTAGVEEQPPKVRESRGPVSAEPYVNGTSTKLQEPTAEVEEPPPKVREFCDPLSAEPYVKGSLTKLQEPETETHLHPVGEHDSTSEVGFFKRILRKWFGGKDGKSLEKSCSKPEKSPTEAIKTEEKCVKSTSPPVELVGPASFSSVIKEEGREGKNAMSSEAHVDKSTRDPGFFSQFIRWCKFWSTPDSDNSGEQSSDQVNQVKKDYGKNEIFSKESFWNDMEAFMDTLQGSDLVLQSKTRIQMTQNLQKQGPQVLRALSESDLLHLVDLLISEKKWVEECPSQTSPFTLIRPAGKISCSHPCSSNGLRSLFLDKPSVSSTQRLSEHDVERRHQNLPHTEVSPPVIHKKPSGKSRNEILADCQKLVDEIVKEYPGGFNMGAFRKLFLERFGYSLCMQKLGYQRLVTLLQIMHGVKIESNHMLPSGEVSKSSGQKIADLNIQENKVSGKGADSDSELSDASRKDDDLDSQWEELGPVAKTGPKRNEMESGLNRKVKEEITGQMHHEYETLSDYDSSDSEEEILTGSEGQGKPRINEEDSTLLQILDSWYSNKEDGNRRDASENLDGISDCSRNDVKPSASNGVGTKSEISCGRKQRPFKTYSFVSDQVEEKDKLIDGILGSLKKTGDTSAESRINGC